MRVRTAPIPIGKNVPNKSNDLNPVSIGAYSPKIKSKFDGLRPGTRIPRASKEPARIKFKNDADKLPTTKLSP